jgi:hypothetical protein
VRAAPVLLLACTACAAAGSSNRGPAPSPPPSPGAIANVGFDRAMRMGSDYVVASTGVTPTVQKAQTLPSGNLELTFDMGPGVPEPVRVVVDPNQGKVQTLPPVEQVSGVTSPAAPR